MRATFNITVMMLPPNMTAVLKLMDPIVNAIIKPSSIRRERIRLLHEVQGSLGGAASVAKPHVVARLLPPKPTQTECLQNIRNELQTDRFKDSLRRAVVTSCSAPDTTLSVPAYLKYQPKRHGTRSALKPAGLQVMDLVHDVDVHPRPAE